MHKSPRAGGALRAEEVWLLKQPRSGEGVRFADSSFFAGNRSAFISGSHCYQQKNEKRVLTMRKEYGKNDIYTRVDINYNCANY